VHHNAQHSKCTIISKDWIKYDGTLYRSTAGLESISSLLKLYMSNNEIQVYYTPDKKNIVVR
jgi:hypothetical protein